MVISNTTHRIILTTNTVIKRSPVSMTSATECFDWIILTRYIVMKRALIVRIMKNPPRRFL